MKIFLKLFQNIIQNIVFSDVYKDSSDSERPKYGSINICKSICGDVLCHRYGEICLKYKDEVKERSTFTFGDSFLMMTYVCTFKNLDHILFHLDIYSINKIINLINNENINKIPLNQYIEAQIHGDVDITKDVESISIPLKIYDENKLTIERFTIKYPNIKILIY